MTPHDSLERRFAGRTTTWRLTASMSAVERPIPCLRPSLSRFPVALHRIISTPQRLFEMVERVGRRATRPRASVDHGSVGRMIRLPRSGNGSPGGCFPGSDEARRVGRSRSQRVQVHAGDLRRVGDSGRGRQPEHTGGINIPSASGSRRGDEQLLGAEFEPSSCRARERRSSDLSVPRTPEAHCPCAPQRGRALGRRASGS